ncbi:MAG: hypothetical protein IKK46_09850 [Clostridia bacterium]|nr:hypothetical protein [Clostridia bacterium]
MNVLLIGNGFDLYYNLPTKYANFLHTVDFLINNYSNEMKSVGDVFSQEVLQNEDSFIKECYSIHKSAFDATVLDAKRIEYLIEIVKDNEWFTYLLKSYNKDVGWIDFEKEIAFVIERFDQMILPDSKTLHYGSKYSKVNKNILSIFNYFVELIRKSNYVTVGSTEVKQEFLVEEHLGSGELVVDKKKVIDYLVDKLETLSRALAIYLECFIESVCDLISREHNYRRIGLFSLIDYVVNFNYTNTYEKLYSKSSIFHIHGNINDSIVLGINPNVSDELVSVDTSFIKFKKYFQRTFYETDYEYIRWMSELKHNNEDFRLVTMGHSLDVTDKDIILELFENANEIIILYHDKQAKFSYISRLVELFGKDGFDSLRKEKQLTFLPLNKEFYELEKKIENENWNKILEPIVAQCI